MAEVFKVTGLDGVLDMLHKLPPEIVAKGGGPVRVALRKGAMVIVKQARINFRSAVAQPGASGITESTGFTERQIVAKRKRPRNNEKGERYIVSVNYVPHPSEKMARRASRSTKGKPRKRGMRAVMANDIAFMMEYGTSRQAATPWLRPAFASKAREAIEVASDSLVKGIARIVKKKGGTFK